MSKVLVIPDVHLKPFIFERATKIMESGQADLAVVLGDIPDDWGKHLDLNLYDDTYNAATEFTRKFKTLWCWGNHDYSYPFRMDQSGYSYEAAPLVRRRIDLLRDITEIRVTWLVDNVLFSHAGLTQTFAKRLVPDELKWEEDATYVFNLIETCHSDELWLSSSPLWARPQDDYDRLTGKCINSEFRTKMWKEGELLQVVGHTPTKKILQMGSVLTTDVFSTYNDEANNYPPIGEQRFAIVDTVNKTWEYAKEELC